MNLNQITVPSLDVAKSIAFYKTLGLKLIVHSHDRYARFECPEGDATFSIHQVEEISKGEKPIIYFECQQLDTQVADLISRGIKFIELPNDKEWAWREAHLKDPFENPIVLFYAGENRKNPPWRLKA